MRYKLLPFFFLYALIGWPQSAPLQIKQLGFPFIRNYESVEYGLQSQNWCAISDSLGIMHFGNNGGLISFDGTEWTSLYTNNKEGIRSLDADKNKKIYYGSVNDIGYLEADTNGQMRLVSLTDQLPITIKEFGIVHHTIAIGDLIFFQSLDAILQYNTTKNTFKVYQDHDYYHSFNLDEKYFVTSSAGVLSFENDSLQPIILPDFAEETLFLAQIEENFVGITGAQQVTIYNSLGTKSFHSIEDDLRGALVSDITTYQNLLLIPTSNRGFYVFQEDGKRLLHLSADSGLGTNNVYNFYIDRYENLWVMHANGISHVQWSSPYSILDKRNNIQGGIVFNKKVGDFFYAATTEGLFRADWKSGELSFFEKLNKKPQGYWYLLNDNETVIAGRVGGIDLIKSNGEARTIYESKNTVWAMDFSESKNYVLTGSSSGSFVLLKKEKNDWSVKNEIRNIRLASDFIINIKDLEFWMSNSGTGVYKLKINEALDSISSTYYGEEAGLPSTYDNRIFRHNDNVIFATSEGLFLYDSTTDSFKKYEQFSSEVNDERVFRFVQSPEGKIWFDFGNESNQRGYLDPSNNGYNKLILPAYKLVKYNNEMIDVIDDSNNFIAGLAGILHVNTLVEDNRNKKFNALITSVKLITNDSIIAEKYFNREQKKIFEYDINSLRFKLASNFYEESEFTNYQWKLEGYEDKWSTLSQTKTKDYTNLSPGNYRFIARAQNSYGSISDIDVFQFIILPPWYLTWWAYSVYGLLFVLIFIIALHFNSRRLKAENERLEGVVEERTQEIRSQKETIEKSLTERESLLKEIHHRVKNNLQIIASLLYLQSGKFEDEDFKKVLEEGQGRVRSMALIHQKLYENEDLKSIPFGEYLNELVSEIRASFGMRNILLNIEASDIHFDVDTAVPLGLIVNEMATNAFKYAYSEKEKGTFSIFLTEENGQYQLNVEDDGKGIPDEIDIRKTKSLGLRLVRMLSQQLEGEFKFQSDHGTSFELKFAA